MNLTDRTVSLWNARTSTGIVSFLFPQRSGNPGLRPDSSASTHETIAPCGCDSGRGRPYSLLFTRGSMARRRPSLSCLAFAASSILPASSSPWPESTTICAHFPASENFPCNR